MHLGISYKAFYNSLQFSDAQSFSLGFLCLFFQAAQLYFSGIFTVIGSFLISKTSNYASQFLSACFCLVIPLRLYMSYIAILLTPILSSLCQKLLQWFDEKNFSLIPWCSGHHIRLTRGRSLVKSSAETPISSSGSGY